MPGNFLIISWLFSFDTSEKHVALCTFLISGNWGTGGLDNLPKHECVRAKI